MNKNFSDSKTDSNLEDLHDISYFAQNTGKKISSVGGQAVIEGVMMRSPRFWAVAVRQNDKDVVVKDYKVKSLASKFKFLKWPILRGVTALIENLVIGIKALNISASLSLGEEDEEQLTGFHIALSFIMAMALVVTLFMALPWFMTKLTKSLVKNKIAFTLVEGFIRISIFVGYVYLISMMKDIKRVFQYHGAEHKAVNSFENDEVVNIENASKYSTIHVRCGTNFVLIVFIMAIVIFSFLPVNEFLPRLIGKMLLAPIIAGFAYEIIKRASKTNSRIIKIIIKPGLLLQRITTREPDERQTEVAVAALNRVLELEANEG